jgi:hypothetical protein
MGIYCAKQGLSWFIMQSPPFRLCPKIMEKRLFLGQKQEF